MYSARMLKAQKTLIVFSGLVAFALSGVTVQAQNQADQSDKKVQKPSASQSDLPSRVTVTLNRLFGRLRKSGDERTANAIATAIWTLWGKSGSPTADLLLNQATKATAARNYRTAIDILDTIIDLKPEFAEAWNKRATVYYLDRQFERSLADIDKVLELEPRHFGALAGLGSIKVELGDKAGALDAFRRALSIHPHLPSAKRGVKKLAPDVEQKI